MTNVSAPLPTPRAELLDRLAQPHLYDLAVIGGGATGLGVALDAAARGFSVVLVDSIPKKDFFGGKPADKLSSNPFILSIKA